MIFNAALLSIIRTTYQPFFTYIKFNMAGLNIEAFHCLEGLLRETKTTSNYIHLTATC